MVVDCRYDSGRHSWAFVRGTTQSFFCFAADGGALLVLEWRDVAGRGMVTPQKTAYGPTLLAAGRRRGHRTSNRLITRLLSDWGNDRRWLARRSVARRCRTFFFSFGYSHHRRRGRVKAA